MSKVEIQDCSELLEEAIERLKTLASLEMREFLADWVYWSAAERELEVAANCLLEMARNNEEHLPQEIRELLSMFNALKSLLSTSRLDPHIIWNMLVRVIVEAERLEEMLEALRLSR